jgi:hypothetical protein
MRPISENVADAIGQHCPGADFDEDACSCLIEGFELWQELHRLDEVVDQA